MIKNQIQACISKQKHYNSRSKFFVFQEEFLSYFVNQANSRYPNMTLFFIEKTDACKAEIIQQVNSYIDEGFKKYCLIKHVPKIMINVIRQITAILTTKMSLLEISDIEFFNFADFSLNLITTAKSLF